MPTSGTAPHHPSTRDRRPNPPRRTEPRRRVRPQDEAVTIHHSARYQVRAPEAGTVKAAIAAFAEHVANEPGSKIPTAWQQKTTRRIRPPLRVHRPVRAAGTPRPGRRTKIRNRRRVERRTLRSARLQRTGPEGSFQGESAGGETPPADSPGLRLDTGHDAGRPDSGILCVYAAGRAGPLVTARG